MALFVDNNAVRDVSISGRARKAVGMALIESLLLLEVDSNIFPWYARVPSPSNIADAPSRGKTEELMMLGATRIDVEEHVSEVLSKLRQ